jgi:hypothetical protein
MVRCKLTLTKVAKLHWANPNAAELTFSTVYDTAIPEDVRFQQATPSGTFTQLVDNPAALAQFELGKSYYVDFTPVPDAAPQA